jgi:hypothetical protein
VQKSEVKTVSSRVSHYSIPQISYAYTADGLAYDAETHNYFWRTMSEEEAADIVEAKGYGRSGVKISWVGVECSSPRRVRRMAETSRPSVGSVSAPLPKPSMLWNASFSTKRSIGRVGARRLHWGHRQCRHLCRVLRRDQDPEMTTV